MITVVVADDETLLRDALEAILGLQDDIEVVAVAASGTEAIAQITHHHPDVAVLDLQMPGADGIEVTEAVREAAPGTHCMILTSHARPGYLKRALAAGARSFIPKSTSARTLADIIRRVHDGQRYVDPELSAEVIAAGDSPLTPREADVLALAADGSGVWRTSRAAPTSARVRPATTSPPRPSSSRPPTGMLPPRLRAPRAGSESGHPPPWAHTHPSRDLHAHQPDRPQPPHKPSTSLTRPPPRRSPPGAGRPLPAETPGHRCCW